MPDQVLTDDEVLAAGMAALTQALGPVDAIRFIRLFDSGSGDYTAERHQVLGNRSVEEVLELIHASKASRGS